MAWPPKLRLLGCRGSLVVAFVLAWAAPTRAQSSAPPDPVSAHPREFQPAFGQYVDESGRILEVDEQYERTHRTPAPHHLRSLTEMAIGLGIFSLGYWTTADRQLADWDDPALEDRFTGSAWRFDNNHLVVNYILHPFGGGVTHALARGNHHSLWEAAGYGFLSSFLWEFGFEFREKVSVNDLIVTTATGIPLGEFAHKLGFYLQTIPDPGFGTHVAEWTTAIGVRLDRALDDTDFESPMKETLWHDLQWSATVGAVERKGHDEALWTRWAFEGTLVSLPGYLQTGRFSKFFHQADISSLTLAAEGSRHGPGLAVVADTLLLGHHLQDLRGLGTPQGYALTYGASLAFRYLQSKANGVLEQLGLTHLPGPAVDFHVRQRDWQLRLGARLHVDFAGAGVLSYDEWIEDNQGEIGKHILKNQDYFYGWGPSGELAGELRWGPVELRGHAFYARYRSQEGLNRWQDRITIDVPARTEYLEYGATLLIHPPHSSTAFGFSAGVRRWDTWAGEFRGRARTLSRGFHLSHTF